MDQIVMIGALAGILGVIVAVLRYDASPMDEAISTAGGVTLETLDAHLMARAMPGLFAAGEMLDWEAPTGGYLLSACLASGRVAAQGVLQHLHIR